MPVPPSSGDFPAVSAPKFYGGGPPRPYLYKDAKISKEKIDPPSPIADSFLSWAREAQLTMSSLRFDRRRTQGRIDGSIRRLREDEEEEEDRGNQKKRPKMETIDSGESDDVDSSEEEQEEAEEAPDSDESQNSSDSEEVDEAEDTTDSEESKASKDREEEEGEEQDVKEKQPVGCRRSKRLKGRW